MKVSKEEFLKAALDTVGNEDIVKSVLKSEPDEKIYKHTVIMASIIEMAYVAELEKRLFHDNNV